MSASTADSVDSTPITNGVHHHADDDSTTIATAVAGDPASTITTLKHEAALHTAAMTPEVLAAEAQSHQTTAEKEKKQLAMNENELQEEPEIIEMPIDGVVTDPESLTREIDRLLSVLSSVQANWQLRVGALKRLSSLQRDATATQQPNFPAEMLRMKSGIVEQLTDRRSLVVKQACEAISAIVTQFKQNYTQFDESSASSSSSATSAYSSLSTFTSSQAIWLDLTRYFIDSILPIIPITVQVINSAACLCLNVLVKNCAGVYREGVFDYPIINQLLTSGVVHKHGIVRDHSFRGLSNSLIRLDDRYVKRENEMDKTIQEAASAEASAPNPESKLFADVEIAIQSGVNDSFDKTRAAARLALIQFQSISPVRAARIIASMTPAQAKIYQQQKAEYEMNKSIGSTRSSKKASHSTASTSSSSSSSSSSSNSANSTTASDDELEAELNTISKKPLATKKPCTPKSSATPFAYPVNPSLKSKLAADKKLLMKKKKNGDAIEEEDIIVVAPPVKSPAKNGTPTKSENETGDKKKVENEDAPSSADEADDEASDNNSRSSSVTSTPPKASKSSASTASSEVTPITPPIASSSAVSASASASASSSSTAVVSPNGQSSLYSRNFTLLSKLLDLESPCLTDKMISFLLHEGVMDVFMSFIARIEPDEVTNEKLMQIQQFSDFGAKYHNVYELDDDVDGEKLEFSDLPLVQRNRPAAEATDEQTAVRRSYHVMQLLCGQRQSQSLMAVLTTKIPAVVIKLMCVFHPKSKGNFFHACCVLQKLITVFPGTVLTTLCSPTGRVLLSLMFDHLHEPSVIPCLLAFFTSSIEYKVNGPTIPADLVHHLKQMDILHTKLVARMVDSPCVSRVVSQGSCDFILRYIEKILTLQSEKQGENLCRLFEGIGAEGKMIDMLSKALNDTSADAKRPQWMLSNISLVLQTLIVSSADESITVPDTDVNSQALAQMMGTPAVLQKHVTNPLFVLKKEIQRGMSAKLVDFCNTLTHGESVPTSATAASSSSSSSSSSASDAASSVNDSQSPVIKFSSYTVTASFTSRRFQLLKLVIKLVQNDIDQVVNDVEQMRKKKSLYPSTTFTQTPLELLNQPRLFSLIPHSTWFVLIEWFFTKTHNNFYLNAFKQLVLSILKLEVNISKTTQELKGEVNGSASAASSSSSSSASSGLSSCDETLKFLLVEAKLLTRMIAFYQLPASQSSSARSFVLDLCNHFRLSCDLLSHSCTFYTYIQSCQQWHSFLPTLQEESLKQAHNLHVKPYHEDPGLSQRAELERALGFSLGGGGTPPVNPNAFKLPAGYVEGIELGSVFAWHLGFLEKVSKARKKRMKKKKNKKKKNKSKGGVDSLDSHDHDHDGSDQVKQSDSESDGEDDANESASSSASSSPMKSIVQRLKIDEAPVITTDVKTGGPSPSAQNGGPLLSPSPPTSPSMQAKSAASELH